MTTNPNHDAIRQAVRQRYAEVAQGDRAGCGCGPSCCDSSSGKSAKDLSGELGYSAVEMESVPEGSNMGLGCGNPQAIAALGQGETVLDLGSGGGFDCFLAARQVGEGGRVIGVDMTPEMVAKARAKAQTGHYTNTEFRLGEIENLPAADGTVDVVISNCVINLSPNKPRVFQEVFRVLRPGGRLAVSDIVAFAPLPEAAQQDLALYTACLAGASLVSDVETMLAQAGFVDIRVEARGKSRSLIQEWAPDAKLDDYLISADITATKPNG